MTAGTALRVRVAAAGGGGCALICFAVVLVLTHAAAPAAFAALAGAVLGAALGVGLVTLIGRQVPGRPPPSAVPFSPDRRQVTGPPDASPEPRGSAPDGGRPVDAPGDQVAVPGVPSVPVGVRPQDAVGTVLSAMLDGVVLLDAEGNLTFTNAAARQLIPPDEEGEDTDAPLHGTHLAAIARRVQEGETIDETFDLDGGRRTVRLHATPLDGAEMGGVVVLQDLTEARRLDRVRQEFVANASHELLTPIGTVRALVDTLARGGLEDRKAARRFLKQLRVEADRLTALARDLVDLAEAQTDELHLELQPTDVDDVIATVLERLHAPAAKANVALQAVGEGRTPLVMADAARLEQVLINLAHNAIKFTGSGGRVTISTEAHEREVGIRVTDTGIGIAAADLPRVFERFYKVRGTSGSAGGTGLGLAIVRHLVGAMHGEIVVESEVGTGTTFTVTLGRSAGPER
jgi:two-component system, OmpR family, phosphate regulon sensor histidine kinase PhoR